MARLHKWLEPWIYEAYKLGTNPTKLQVMGNHLSMWKKGLEADLVHGHTCVSHLISAIGGHAMLLQHVCNHCISLHARLETSQARTQKAQTPMRADMVVDSYMMRPHIVTEWAIAAADVVHLLTIDGHTFVERWPDPPSPADTHPWSDSWNTDQIHWPWWKPAKW